MDIQAELQQLIARVDALEGKKPEGEKPISPDSADLPVRVQLAVATLHQFHAEHGLVDMTLSDSVHLMSSARNLIENGR